MSMINNTVVMGLDIGNGYVKGACLAGVSPDLKEVRVDIPSCAVGLASGLAVPDEPTDDLVSDIFNQVVCAINSPLVSDDRYFMFGQRALGTGHQPIEFDIADVNLSKSQQELSSTLILGMVASSAFKDFWDANSFLPKDTLRVEAHLALALPIGEFVIYRETFAKKFLNATHVVHICNFNQMIKVEIHFKNVQVLPEGVSAQYAITRKGIDFIQALLNDVRSRDVDVVAEITAEDIITCRNTCGIDIGEGTVNFPVILDGKFNSVASSTIQMGFGTVVEQSLPSIQRANMPWSTRKLVVDFLQKETTAFNKKKKMIVKGIINAEAVDLVDAIIREVAKILRSGSIEVIYVYGGGATPMKEALHDKLIEKTKTFSGGDDLPILYLDSKYARNLNREGLFDLAKSKFSM